MKVVPIHTSKTKKTNGCKSVSDVSLYADNRASFWTFWSGAFAFTSILSVLLAFLLCMSNNCGCESSGNNCFVFSSQLLLELWMLIFFFSMLQSLKQSLPEQMQRWVNTVQLDFTYGKIHQWKYFFFNTFLVFRVFKQRSSFLLLHLSTCTTGQKSREIRPGVNVRTTVCSYSGTNNSKTGCVSFVIKTQFSSFEINCRIKFRFEHFFLS